MKKTIAQVKSWITKNKYVSAALLVLGCYLLYKIGNWIFYKIKGNAAIKSAAANYGVNGTVDVVKAQSDRCQGIADSVYSLIHNVFIDQDEKAIVKQVNLLQTESDVKVACDYYKSTYDGISLKADLLEALADDWRGTGKDSSIVGWFVNPNATGGRFSDIKPLIQKSLF